MLLSRVYLRSDTEIAGPCLAVLTDIVVELQKRKEPLQQLLQSRYGFYGRPFEADLFTLEPVVAAANKATRGNNIATSFSALNQLVNAANEKEKTYGHLDVLSLKRSCDLLDVEPLPFSLASASDGARLERADTGNFDQTKHNQIMAVIGFFFLTFSNGIHCRKLSVHGGGSERFRRGFETRFSSRGSPFVFQVELRRNKLRSIVLQKTEDTAKECHKTLLKMIASVEIEMNVHPQGNSSSHKWQHLLCSGSTLYLVMERLHSGVRKFVVLDFGSSVILTDVFIPSCVDWMAITIDVWNRTERTNNGHYTMRSFTSSLCR